MIGTFTFLRRGPDEEHLTKDHVGRVAGAVYTEYTEVWERLTPEETPPDQVKIQRLSQESTGKQYVYVDKITPEFHDDSPGVKEATKSMMVVMQHDDFTMHRLREFN